MSGRQKKPRTSKGRANRGPTGGAPQAKNGKEPGGEQSRLTALLGAELKKGIVAGVVLMILALPLWIIGDKPTVNDVRRWISARTQERSPGSNFTILVADLEGDGRSRSQTLRLARSLRQSGGFEVRLVGRTLPTSTVGSLSTSDAAASEVGRKWLDALNGDVLIWGQVLGPSLVLGFVPRGEPASDLRGYALPSQTLELPKDFTEELGVQVHAVVLSMLVSAAQERGSAAFVARLDSTVTKLRGLVHHPGPFSASTNANIAHSFAFAVGTLGQQTGEARWLEEAIGAYQTAMSRQTRQQNPLFWAAAQSNSGNFLISLAQIKGDPVLFDQAINSYRSALEGFPREDSPFDWAGIQNNLGKALWEASQYRGDAAQLDEAAARLRLATEELTNQNDLRGSAMVHLNLGLVLGELGAIRADETLFRQSISSYRIALKELDQDSTAMLWSWTQSNLASTLFEFSEQRGDTAGVKEAVEVFRAALQKFPRDEAPFHWALMQQNLGNALSSVGIWRKSTGLLEQAVASFTLALEEIEPERAPLMWATVQVNLGQTLSDLGRMTQSRTLVEDAVNAFELALQVYTSDGLPRAWAGAKNNLAGAFTDLALMRRDPLLLSEAIEAQEEAVQGYIRAGDTYAVSRAGQNLRRLRQLIQELRSSPDSSSERLREVGRRS